MEQFWQPLPNISQNYLITSLNKQIDSMLPIKRSHVDLQHYHLKISHDYQYLLQDHKSISQETIQKLKDQNILQQKIEQDKYTILEDIKNLEKEKAKNILQRNNLLSVSESLLSKINLQKEQNILLINRKHELIDIAQRLTQPLKNIELINIKLQEQLQDKNKALQIIETQKNKVKQFYQRLRQKNQYLETKIKQLSQNNRSINNDNKLIDNQINHKDKEIQKIGRKNWEYNQLCIEKSRQMRQINNQKQYYLQMLQGQQNSYQFMIKNVTKLQQHIKLRQKQLNDNQMENYKIIEEIKQENIKYNQKKQQQDIVNLHLETLIQCNRSMINQMEKWTIQDLNIIKIIQNKTGRLQQAIGNSRKILGDKNSNIQQKTNKSWMTTKISKWKQ